MSAEAWRPVVGHEGDYEVSSLGRVRRARDAGRGIKAGMIIKSHLNHVGYPSVTLNRTGQARSPHPICVHKLVTDAFLGPCPPGHNRNHIDGNKTNSHLNNLEYVTNSENQRHALRMGLYTPARGEQCASAKLTGADVAEIRRIYALGGISQTTLGAKFGVSNVAVSGVVRRATWRHIA